MKTALKALALAALAIGVQSTVDAQQGWRNVSEFVAYSGQSRRISWTPDPSSDGYHVQVRSVERPSDIVLATHVVAPPITWIPQRGGHYRIDVRGYTGSGASRVYGPWCQSTSATCTQVNGEPLAFYAYVTIAPPSGGTVE